MKKILFAAISLLFISAAQSFALAPNTVDTDAIIDGEVKAADIGFNAISSSRIVDGAVTSDKILDNTISAADIGTGAVTTDEILNSTITSGDIADLTIGTADIANGAITNALITGPISASKIESGVFAVNPTNVIVVAKAPFSGFTSIRSALSSITPSASNPYLIEVKPGKYVENIILKSYVHLQGSGANVTKIESGVSNQRVFSLTSVTDVRISGFTVSALDVGSSDAFYVSNSTLVAADNVITGDINGNYHDCGFDIYGNSSNVTMENNDISGVRYGIYATNSGTIKVINNYIHDTDNYGIRTGVGYAIIEGNEVTNNPTGIDENSTSAMIRNNNFSGNTDDLHVSSNATFSFNVFDNHYGSSSLGIYNIDSSNTAW